MGKRGGSAPAAATSFGSRNRDSRLGTSLSALEKANKSFADWAKKPHTAYEDVVRTAQKHGFEVHTGGDVDGGMWGGTDWDRTLFKKGDVTISVYTHKKSGRLRDATASKRTGEFSNLHLEGVYTSERDKRKRMKALFKTYGG